MDNEKAIRAAKLTLGGILEKRRAKAAVERAQGQIAPSKYLPDVPRQVHAYGGYVPTASLPIPKLAVAAPIQTGRQPGVLDVLGSLASLGKSARSITDLVSPEKEEVAPEPHASRAEPHEGGLTPEAMAAMEALRKGWSGPEFGIVSGYRTPEQNKAAKGAKDSQHIHGNAYDVNTTGWSPEDKLALANAAWDAGFRGFGFYDNNMHFDVGGPRAWGPSHSRDSIPDWAQGWAQERYGYAEGGEVTDLGQAREKKQLQTYHTGMMDDIHQRMSNAMEAHEKAVDAGVFDGYEVGDMLQGSAHPMRITGRYMQKWKPTTMALRSFERMGTQPTIIEHEGEQYIPMLRYETGKEGMEGFQQGSAYLDGIKAAGYQKMGGLRAVKARGGAVEFMAGNHPEIPDVLYHGNALKVATKGWTSEIDHDQTEKNIAAQDFREFRPSEYGNYGKGIYLTDHPETASEYAMGIRADQKEPKPHGQVMKLHVSMKQPFTDRVLRNQAWKDYIKGALTKYSIPHSEDRAARDSILKALENDTLTVRKLFLRDTPEGTMVNQHGQHEIHDTIRNSGFDGIIAHRPDGSREYVAFRPEQVKSALSARKFDPTSPDMTYADGGSVTTKTKDGSEIFGNGALIHRYTHPETGGYIDVLQRPNGPASVLGLEVPEEHRGKGIGQMLQAEAMERHPELMGQVSSKAAATTAYRLGRRPYNAPNATLDDVFSAIDRDSSVNMLSPQAQPKATGGAVYTPQKTVKAYKLFRTKDDGKLYPLFVHADKPVPMGEWLEAEEGPQGKAEGKVKSKLGDLAYRPGWHAGDLPMATHIGGKSDPSLKKPDYRPDNHVWAEVEMAADKDWQSVADSRGKGVKAHITDQVPYGGFYRYKTNPNMTGNWLIGGHMKVNRVLPDEEVKAINDAAGTADLPRIAKADGGSVDGLPHWSEGTMSSADAASKLQDASAHPGVDMQLMPLRPGQYSHDGEEHDGPEVWIEWLKRHDAAPKGAAALAMSKLTSAADHTNSVLRLEPDQNDPALIKYYKKFGFEEDPSGGEIMERTPRLSMKRQGFAAGGAAMFEGIHEDLQDEQGNPLELWHGTPGEPFDEFKDEKLGSTRDHGFYGRGHYLTPDQENAAEYAGSHADEGTLMGPLHAALKNPYIWDASEQGAHRTLRDLQSMGIMKGQDRLEPWDNLQRHHIDPFMREMQKRGHDGVIVRTNDYREGKPHRVSEIVVFKPSAIKHKDAERFDPNDPNIYHARGGVAK